MNVSDIPFLIHGVQYDVGPPFAARTASTLLGRLSTRFRSVFMGIIDHSSRSSFVRSHTDVGPEGLALSLCSNSSQRCSMGLRSGLCAGQSSSSTPDSVIHVFMDLALCTGAHGGGQVYRENLCISRQPFTFVTVRSQPGTCSIRSVKAETKHLILACEVLENQCLPVHFEGNPEDLRFFSLFSSEKYKNEEGFCCSLH
uniref:Uncharacterized protein n=1 Tax=Amphiprion percula TaxID=161767 RepID=A0A3P8S0T8_AMPPE